MGFVFLEAQRTGAANWGNLGIIRSLGGGSARSIYKKKK